MRGSEKETCLDEDSKVTAVIIVGDGGVATGNFFAVDFSRNLDVLSCWETKDVLGVGKRETVARDASERVRREKRR